MSNKINRDLVYCLRILETIAKINIYSSEFKSSIEFFNSNYQLNFNAVLNLFAQIGENIKKISKELKAKYKTFPWQQVKGFRNKIIHEYTGIDFDLTFKIVKSDLPGIETQMFVIISSEIKAGNFNIEDLNAIPGNFFYSNIDFNRFKFE